MTNPVVSSSFHRSDWDFTGRTKIAIDVLLGQLSREASPVEREDIVRRLTNYVRDFPEEYVDFEHLNEGLRANGFEALNHSPSAGKKKRPLAEMTAAEKASMERASHFFGYEIPEASRWATTAGKGRLAELGKVISGVGCNECMTQEEFDTAMGMLRRAAR